MRSPIYDQHVAALHNKNVFVIIVNGFKDAAC